MSHAGTALLDPHPIFKKIALAEGMRVADFGCGRTGHFVFPASRTVKETGVVYAIDVIKNIVESIRSRVRSEGYGNVQVIWADIERAGSVPIPAGSLDVGFMINVLFLVKDQTAVLAEAHRLLRTNGYAVVIEWKKNLGLVGPSNEVMVSPEHLKTTAEQVGLQPVDFFPLNDYHYCLILKKP